MDNKKEKTIYLFYCILIFLGSFPFFIEASIFRWEIGLYSKCSTSCGRGAQSRSVTCIDVRRRKEAPERMCSSPRPSAVASCAIIACAPEWLPEDWGECSKSCGKGVQTRQLRCKQRIANGRTVAVSEDYCPRLRPQGKRRCGYVDCPARYTTKKWTTCSAPCGGGIQFRVTHCTRIKAGSHHPLIIPRSYCDHLTLPEVKRKCNVHKCSDAVARGLDGGAKILRSLRRKLLKSRQMMHGRKKPVELLRRERRLHSPIRRRHVSSRRRSTTNIERGRMHRCSHSLSLRSHSRRNVDFDTLPCLEEQDFKQVSTPQHIPTKPKGSGRQALRETKFTLPHISTQGNDIQPVLRLGTSEIVTYVGGTLTVSDTDTVTILCEASGFPPPVTEWLKDGFSLGEDDRHVLLGDRSLRIIRPRIYDGGNYTCVATNFVGRFSASTALSVATKPKIMSSGYERDELGRSVVKAEIGSVIRASPGSSIRISCPAKGFPPPRIRWEKDVAGLGDNVRIMPDNSLVIDLASPVDQGSYNCEATNPIGTDYRTTTLLLFEAPKLQEVLTSKDMQVQAAHGLPRLLMASIERPTYKIDRGSSALVGCPVTSLGDIDMFWTLGGRPIGFSLLESKYEILVEGKVLFLEHVNENTKGIYTCHSSNEAGNLTASLEVRIAEYSWQRGKMSQCSHTCGGNGFQQVEVKCMRERNEPVADRHCDPTSKPVQRKVPCNRVDCPPKFHIGAWGQCSTSCGRGARRRKVSCLVQKHDDSLKMVDSAVCEVHLAAANVAGTKRRPLSVESCVMKACPRWSTGPWSQCGDKCYGIGMGIRKRRVDCLNGDGEPTSRLHCQQSERPRWRELCFTMRCEPVWVVSKWSSCSHTCGENGIKTRILNCLYRGNRIQRAGNACNITRRPPVTTACGRIPCSHG